MVRLFYLWFQEISKGKIKVEKMLKETKNEPVHVLHVVGNMGIGGIETLIMNIYRNIDRSKVQFDFLIHNPTEGEYADEIKRMGGKIYRMPVLRDKTHTYYWRYFEYKRALKRFFFEHPEIEIVHGHMTNTAAIYMPIAKKYGNVKYCIAHSHQTEATPGLSGFVTNILQRNLEKLATDYFACSEEAAKWIYSPEVVEAGRVKVIHNGADVEKYHYDKEEHDRLKSEMGHAGKIVIGNVARFKKQKNHTFLIDIFAEIQKLNKQTVLILVGQGELEEEMKKKVSRLGLEDCVEFQGARSDVPTLLKSFDLFLLPSLFEGLPLVGIEAQAAGLPMVASDTVTPETDITGNVTFLSLDLPAEEWARKILNVCSDFERVDMTEAVRNAGYDIKQTAQWLQDFYLEKTMNMNK